MSTPSYTITNESITVVWKGEVRTVQAESPNYGPLKTAITEERWDDIEKYLNVASTLDDWSEGEFAVEGENITFKGDPVPTSFGQRVLAVLRRGEDVAPLLRFFERLQHNPSKRSVDQLFTFLQHCNIPITEDGCFLAYKGVRTDLKDCHSGQWDNSPGARNTMPRNRISDDPRESCHEGFHVGALRYAQNWGQRTVVCKVDPEHVVSVPYDSSHEKMRVYEYEVIGNYGTPLSNTTIPAKDVPVVKPEDKKTVEAAPDGRTPGKVTKKAKVKFELTGVETLSGLTAKVVEQDGNDRTFNDKEIALWESFDHMDTEALLEQSSFNLRRYALHHLGIVGGGRIKGGKVPLVAVICKARNQ